MARDEATAFIEVLALLGVGVEPDVRYGAPALGPGAVVLFRSGTPAWQRPARAGGMAEADRPAPGFATAATIVRCAAVVAAAAGPVVPHGPVWARALGAVADLAMAYRVPASQRSRLAARLGWLLATGVDVARLPRQVTRLTTAEREIAGRWLISVAAAVAPGFPPATVAALGRVYRILGLELDALYHRLHAFSVAGAERAAGPPAVDGADEPVVVRPADPRRDGFALPWSARDEMWLDQAVISRKIDESTAVATLLAAIFETDTDDIVPVAAVENADPIAGLDPAHSALLRALAEQPSWTRDEFAALAGTHGVLPDGALDVLNEAAMDTAGGPVVADGAILAVDDDVLRELLR
jgi:hypothetical protein